MLYVFYVLLLGCDGNSGPTPNAPRPDFLDDTTGFDTDLLAGTHTDDTDPIVESDPEVEETEVPDEEPPVTDPPGPIIVPPLPPAVGCNDGPDAALLALCTVGVAAHHNGITWPTIQAAIDQAAAGDTVTVCPGSWYGGLEVTRSLTLQAADATPYVTTIDGGGRLQGLNNVDGDLTVLGVTFVDGRNTQTSGGAIESSGQATLTVRCATFDGNNAPGDGGAIHMNGTALTIERSTFLGNRSLHGTGIISNGEGALLIRDSLFRRGMSTLGTGGISSYGPTTLINTVIHNTSSDEGPGALSVAPRVPSDLLIVGCEFSENASDYAPSVLDLGGSGPTTVTIADTLISDNHSPEGAVEAILSSPSDLDIYLLRTTVQDNTSGELAIFELGSFRRGPATLVGESLQVLRNVTDRPPVVAVRGTFDCSQCDFGSALNDNVPGDVATSTGSYPDAPSDFRY